MKKFMDIYGEPLKTRFDLYPENLSKNLKYLSPNGAYDDFDNHLSQIFNLFKKYGKNWQMSYSKFKELEGKGYILDPDNRLIVNNWTDIDENNDTITIKDGWLCLIYDKNYRFSITRTIKDLFKILQKKDKNIPQNELFTEANVTSTDLHDVIRESKIFLENTPIAELEKIFTTHQKEISFTSYLNNFDQKIQEAVEEQLSPLMSFLDPQTTIYGKFITENNQNKHSNIYKKNSIAGFRKDIQKAIKICGIDIDDIKKTYEENSTITYGNQREIIFKKIRPIYIQLRKQGYTSYDLIY